MNKKIYTEAELQELARRHFQRLNTNVLYGTTDGQLFILEHRARMHAGGGRVYKLENEDAEDVDEKALLEAIEAVKQNEDANELAEMLKAEVGGQSRSELVNAIEERIDELMNPTAKMNAKDIIEYIGKCENTEELTRIKEVELAKEDNARKTVLKALDERIEQLKAE